MPYDDLKAFRIRQSPKGGRKPAPGPDVEANILDAAEFVFGHFGFRGATTVLIAKKASDREAPHLLLFRGQGGSLSRHSRARHDHVGA
jgi:hypothetical protein